MQQLADKENIEAARQQKQLIQKAKGQKERLAQEEEGIKKANMQIRIRECPNER